MAKNTQEVDVAEKEAKTTAAPTTVAPTTATVGKATPVGKTAPAKTVATPATVGKTNANNPAANAANANAPAEKTEGQPEDANTELATTEAPPAEQKDAELAKTEADKKELTPKQLEAEKLAQKKAYREQKNKYAIENDLELKKKQIIETKNQKKKIIVNGGVFVGGLLAVAGVLLLGIPPYFAAAVLPIWAVTVLKVLSAFKTLPKLKSAHELRIMLIIEQARKTHNDKNKQILEAYKAEKQRIKSLKRLPYKILNYVSFLITMFTIIVLFFVFDIGITATALVLFAIFTVMYFFVGLVMITVAYMISENKQRETMLRLEEEKNRLLIEEKIRSEEAVRVKLEKERKRYEEEERLRIDEQIRVAEEEAERLRLEEEERLRLEEELRVKEEKARKKAEAIAEKERIRQNMIKESRFMRHEYLPPAPTKAEIAKDVEIIRNEFDKKMLDEIGNKFDEINISGIEEFALDKEKIKEEYAAGITFPDVDLSDAGVESEIDNISEVTAKKDKKGPTLTDFDTTDIEEAKNLVFRNARKMAAKAEEDDFTTEDLVKEVKRTVTKKEPSGTSTSGNGNGEKGVTGKSFMMIKQMLKDE